MAERLTMTVEHAHTGMPGKTKNRWTATLITGVMKDVVPSIGPQEAVESMYGAMLAVATHTGWTPEMFAEFMALAASRAAEDIRTIRDIQSRLSTQEGQA